SPRYQSHPPRSRFVSYACARARAQVPAARDVNPHLPGTERATRKMDPLNAFVQALAHSHALEEAQLEEVWRLMPRFPGDPRGLAADLLKRRWLTPFQINRLNTGRGMQLLLGSYVLIERIGEGGMGQVFKARNWKLGQVVALKLIRKELLTNP